jgi:hypothetical protein
MPSSSNLRFSNSFSEINNSSRVAGCTAEASVSGYEWSPEMSREAKLQTGAGRFLAFKLIPAEQMFRPFLSSSDGSTQLLSM